MAAWLRKMEEKGKTRIVLIECHKSIVHFYTEYREFHILWIQQTRNPVPLGANQFTNNKKIEKPEIHRANLQIAQSQFLNINIEYRLK